MVCLYSGQPCLHGAFESTLINYFATCAIPAVAQCRLNLIREVKESDGLKLLREQRFKL